MSSTEAIAGYLGACHATYISSFHVDESPKTVILEVPVSLLRVRAAKGVTSKRQLTYLKRDIEARFDLRVVITVREAQQLTDLESGLRAALLRRFPEHVTDLYMSFPTGDAAQIWVMVKQELDETSGKIIRGHIVEYLANAALISEGIEFLAPNLPEPSIAAILRSLKTISLGAVGQIMNHLRKRGYSCPSERWLSGKLDMSRKRGLIVRNPSGEFSLTSLGLQLVPHTRSGSSSDVDRMLLLGRRRRC